MGYHLRATVGYTDGQGSGKRDTSAVTDPVTRCQVGGEGAVSVAEGRTTVASYTAPSTCGTVSLSSVSWSLSGLDAGAFAISPHGHLAFGTAPDYESPADQPEPGVLRDNVYKVTVEATSAGPPATTASREVTVTVTNVDEAGTVSLSSSSPVVDTELTATLSDPDGSISDTQWKWEANNSSPANWTSLVSPDRPDASTHQYTPRDSDVGYHLRATVGYTDGQGSGKRDTSAVTDPVTRCQVGGEGSVSVAEGRTTVASYTAPSTCGTVSLSSVSWSLSGLDAGAFAISPHGHLAFGTAPDYESPADQTRAGGPPGQRLQGDGGGHLGGSAGDDGEPEGDGDGDQRGRGGHGEPVVEFTGGGHGTDGDLERPGRQHQRYLSGSGRRATRRRPPG